MIFCAFLVLDGCSHDIKVQIQRDKVIMDQPTATEERAQPEDSVRPEIRPEVALYPPFLA